MQIKPASPKRAASVSFGLMRTISIWILFCLSLQAEETGPTCCGLPVILTGNIHPFRPPPEAKAAKFSGGECSQLELPAQQTALFQTLRQTGKPVVLVNCSGRAMRRYDVNAKRYMVDTGKFKIQVGTFSEDIRTTINA